MRLGAIVTALMVLTTACGDSGATTTSGPQPVTGATAGMPTTTATTPPTTTTTLPPATSEPAPTTTATPAIGTPVFSITQITFGVNGFAQIANTGEGPGSLAGYWLCQRPGYFALDAIELEPGQAVWVAAGDGQGFDITTAPTVMALLSAEQALGDFSVRGGELALYSSREFTIAEDIRDFVAWAEPGGLPGLGRAGVAVAAGIWESSGLVAVPSDTISISVTTLPATGPDAWVADSGG